MLKSVKVTISDLKDREKMYAAIKKGMEALNTQGLEGTAESKRKNIIMKVHGPKNVVDEFVNMVDDLVAELIVRYDEEVDMFVEPFFKDEEFRGVFRFLKSRQ